MPANGALVSLQLRPPLVALSRLDGKPCPAGCMFVHTYTAAAIRRRYNGSLRTISACFCSSAIWARQRATPTKEGLVCGFLGLARSRPVHASVCVVRSERSCSGSFFGPTSNQRLGALGLVAGDLDSLYCYCLLRSIILFSRLSKHNQQHSFRAVNKYQ